MKNTYENIYSYLEQGIKNKIGLQGFLNTILENEASSKINRTVENQIRVAGFPSRKTFELFDFNFQPGINKDQILDFASLRFLEAKENIVFLGTSRVGKTHLSTSIGIAAAKRRCSTYFIKCNDLLQQLKRANLENRLDSRLKHFSKYKLLIIDELGYLPIDKEDSKLFFQLLDMRYEKKSTIITTNINFNAWDEIFCDPIIANAILDRVLHHANVVSITGNSYRLKDHFNFEEN